MTAAKPSGSTPLHSPQLGIIDHQRRPTKKQRTPTQGPTTVSHTANERSRRGPRTAIYDNKKGIDVSEPTLKIRAEQYAAEFERERNRRRNPTRQSQHGVEARTAHEGGKITSNRRMALAAFLKRKRDPAAVSTANAEREQPAPTSPPQNEPSFGAGAGCGAGPATWQSPSAEGARATNPQAVASVSTGAISGPMAAGDTTAEAGNAATAATMVAAVSPAMETVGTAEVARSGSSAVKPPTTESAVGGEDIRKRRRGGDDEDTEEHSRTAPIASVPGAVVVHPTVVQSNDDIRTRRRGSDDEGAEEHSTAPIAGVPGLVVPVKKKRKSKNNKKGRPQIGRPSQRTRMKKTQSLNTIH
jgi:hypothetical protein